MLVLAGVFILATRLRVMGSTTPTFQVFDNPHSFVNGTIFRVSMIFKVYHYCKLLFSQVLFNFFGTLNIETDVTKLMLN